MTDAVTPPVRRIKELFKDKRVIAAFPPNRNSQRLASAVDAQFTIGRGRLSQSQLPGTIQKSNGYVIRRPAKWW
jgi:hypothetical protein